MSKLMEALLESDLSFRHSLWRPPADIYRHDKGWLVKMDVAGVDVRDLEVEVQNRYLLVRGRRRGRPLQGYHYYMMEIAYSRFEREFEFPGEIDAARVSVSYREGMLEIHLDTEAD